jgi:hypothetical protein
VIASHGPERELCLRFLDESRGKHGLLVGESYIARMLTEGVPTVLFDSSSSAGVTRGSGGHDASHASAGGGAAAVIGAGTNISRGTDARDSRGKRLDVSVLDAVCRSDAKVVVEGDAQSNQHHAGLSFLPAFAAAGNTGKDIELLLEHPMCVAMERVLKQEGVGPGDTLLLSLSGGVDSTAHAVTLALLQDRFGYELCALHVRHSNRPEEHTDEEQRWVEWIARTIGVTLFGVVVSLQRPHGDKKTGISRERYEDATKRIRFRMYRECFSRMNARAAAASELAADRGMDCAGRARKQWVVMGHHADDVDENRLTELGKGNVVDVDGMTTLTEMLGVTLYRPLLSERKSLM